MFAFLRDPRERLLERMPKGGACAEIGVWKGDFSARILATTKPRRLHLVDPWMFDPTFPQRWYGGARSSGQADMDAIHAGVAARFAAQDAVTVHRMPSLAAAEDFADGALDWVYIDGDHSRAAVLADLTAWRRKVRAGGFLCGDDYRWRDERGQLSVKAAVDEFAHANSLLPEIFRTQFIIPV